MAYTCLVTARISDYRPKVNLHLYGSHPLLFITKQATLIQPSTTQVYFNSVGCPYMYAACFGLYLGHRQICQYQNKNLEFIVSSFVCTLFLFQLDTLLFFLFTFTIFSTCFGPAGPSSGKSNYTCSLWHLSLIRCYFVRGRWC